MDRDLINAYAYSNLERAILAEILSDIIRNDEQPKTALQVYYNRVKDRLSRAEFEGQPANDPEVQAIRAQALELAKKFFRKDVEGLLVAEGTLSGTGLVE